MKIWLALFFALSTVAQAERYYEYRNPSMGFAIAYPMTWKATENAQRTGVTLADGAVSQKESPAFIVSVSAATKGVKLEDYDRIVPRLFAFLLDDYKQHLKQPTTLGGAAARMLLFEAKAGGVGVIGFMSYTLRNNKIYTAAFFSNRSNYEIYRQVGGNILGSFRFL
jgi:hypothetical protein